MADTNHGHAEIGPVEGDGISYRGIVWFIAILVITTLVSQVLMVAAFKWFDHDFKSADAPRAPLAAPVGQMPPAPNLLYLSSDSPQLSEPGNLRQFREKEEAILKGYSYDKASGAAQIPIDRAKDLLLQRGLPSRDTAKPAEPPAKAAAEKKPTPSPADKDDHHEGHEDHEGHELF